jgi:hypothetical protein
MFSMRLVSQSGLDVVDEQCYTGSARGIYS